MGWGALVVKGSPMMLNFGVAWVNPGATQYFINGQATSGTIQSFTLDGNKNIVPKGDDWAMANYFKNFAEAAFNPLKGDCWANSPKAALGDDDEEWYDDDAYWDDDDEYWYDDDDLHAAGGDDASVMAFGDDDGLLNRDDEQKLLQPRDDDDDSKLLQPRDDDDRLFGRDDDDVESGLFGGKKPFSKLFNKKCKRLCKIEKMRIVCTPRSSIGAGWDDEYFDDDEVRVIGLHACTHACMHARLLPPVLLLLLTHSFPTPPPTQPQPTGVGR